MSLRGFDLCRAAMSVVGVTAPEQSVLTALAIMSNDDAQCWPAINGAAGLTGKTKLSERTVQRAVQALKDAGHINWVDKPGRGRVYIVHPRQCDTPNEATPVTETPRQPDTRHSDTPVTLTPTPVTVAPNQPISTNTSTKASPSPRRRASAFVLPDDIPADEWRDFEEMRQSIRKPMTNAARHQAVTRLRKLAAAGWPPGDVLNHSTLNNYQGLFPPKDDGNGRTNGMARSGKPGNHSSGNGLIDAIRESRANREAVPWDAVDSRGMQIVAGLG